LYLQERWQLSKSYGYELVLAKEVEKSAIADNFSPGLVKAKRRAAAAQAKAAEQKKLEKKLKPDPGPDSPADDPSPTEVGQDPAEKSTAPEPTPESRLIEIKRLYFEVPAEEKGIRESFARFDKLRNKFETEFGFVRSCETWLEEIQRMGGALPKKCLQRGLGMDKDGGYHLRHKFTGPLRSR